MAPAEPIATPALHSQPLRMSYRVARGEQGVLSFEPYKSALLPLWRFRSPSIARHSASELERCFKAYEDAGDFVGMDMARKFLQMGMTRAMRYARHKGGRKYDEDGREAAVSQGHKGRREKLEASAIFREKWLAVKQHSRYQAAKAQFLEEQKHWDRHVSSEEK